MATINLLHISKPLAALGFGSAAMLGWLAAAVLPWLIYRWHRQRYQETPWAAVELLLAAMRQRASRVRFQQWLLLAIRTAILLLVALAAAEPILRGGTTRGTARTHHVLVLDQSYSMQCTHQESTRFNRAQSAAQKIVDAAPPGDAFSIIGWSTRGNHVLGRHTFDRSLAKEVIGQLQVLDTDAPLPVAMGAAEAAIDRTRRESPAIEHHRVVLLTDLGSDAWTPGTSIEKAEIVVHDVGDSLRNNLAVTRLTIQPANVLRQQEVTILAHVQAFGSQSWNAMTLELSIDGVRAGRQPFQLAPAGETEIRFTHRFVDEGWHTVQVVVKGVEDALPVDDRRWLVVEVLPRMRIACVAGRRGAADDIARALRLGSSSHVEVVPASRLGALDLPQYEAVVLCNVGDFSRREATALERYVRDGGALAMLLGDEVTGARYQDAFAASGLLPVEIGPLAGEGQPRFDPLEYRHPIVAPFRDREQAGLLGVRVSRYFWLLPVADRPQLQTVLAFDSGDPALVVDSFGRGSVAVLAIPSSLASRTAKGSPWSSFALSPSFLPIVCELVSHLTNARALEANNRVVGQPLVCPVPLSQSAETLWVRLPSGERQTLSAVDTESRGLVASLETTAGGLYAIGIDEQELARFAVNLDTRESDLSVAQAKDLPQGVAIVPGNSNQASFFQTGIDVSLAPLLLAAALVLLFAELLVAWLMGRGWG